MVVVSFFSKLQIGAFCLIKIDGFVSRKIGGFVLLPEIKCELNSEIQKILESISYLKTNSVG